MPFDGSYIDHEKSRYKDAQDYLVEIAKKIIRDPLSTHIVETRSKSGKICYVIVDRSRVPKDGDIAVVASDNGLRFNRLKGKITPKGIVWGKVTWFLQQG